MPRATLSSAALVLAFAAPGRAETTRATPIIALVDETPALVIGTSQPAVSPTAVHGPADVAGFRFPATTGHVRGYATNRIASATSYAAQPALFDATIPQVSYAGCARFASTCRSVFTTVTTGERPARVMLEDATLPLVGPLLASGAPLSPADQRVILRRMLAGREVAPNTYGAVLGGVDRSTAAVIGTSPLTGEPRPTMIYVGAQDGMLHALCGSVSPGVCDRIGRELWAYVPRSLLGAVRTGSVAVDGSPHVVEVMGDFDRNGLRTLRTILLFTTGSTASVYALDITNPANPTVAWEYTATPGMIALGHGLAVTSGRIQTARGPKVYAYVQTNNGGTGGEGSVVTAIDVETGRVAWQDGQLYPDPVRRASNPDVPASGMPGGVTVVNQHGQADQIVFGTLYGDLWVLDAFTGANRRGRGPAFRFSEDQHPFGSAPVLYTDESGETFALAVSGGFADRTGATWSAPTQYAVAISLGSRTVLDERSAGLPIALAFDASGAYRTSRPIVVEKQGLVFATPSKAYRVSLVTNAVVTAPILPGAALGSTGTGFYAAGATALGRVELAPVISAVAPVSHTVATVATDDDSSWW